jgi:mono/diheme cytochrome c family protein
MRSAAQSDQEGEAWNVLSVLPKDPKRLARGGGASQVIHVPHRFGSAGLAVLVAAFVSACAGTPIQLPSLDGEELAARGREDYLRACAPCHGADGRGSADGRVPDLTRLAERLGDQFTRQYIVDVITGEREVQAHGPREMPVWHERFGDTGAEAAAALWAQRQLDAIAAHVESLQVHTAAPAQR